MTQKDSIISSFANIVMKVCDEKHLNEELDHVKNALECNGFSDKKI